MSFSELEKRKICSEIKNNQLTVAEASVKYNCPKSTLYSWLSIYDRSEDMTASIQTANLVLANKQPIIIAIIDNFEY